MSEGMLGNLSLSETQGPRSQLEDRLASKQGRMWLQAFKRFLRRENPWGTPIRFEMTTDGRTGEQWIVSLEERGDRVGSYAKELLRSGEFVATNGVTYRLAVIMGSEFEDADRTNRNIRAEATSRGYLDPTPEVAPYLREMISDEELKRMGVWALVVMHQPITASGGDPDLLGVYRSDGGRWLDTCSGQPDDGWDREVGFVFLVPASTPRTTQGAGQVVLMT